MCFDIIRNVVSHGEVILTVCALHPVLLHHSDLHVSIHQVNLSLLCKRYFPIQCDEILLQQQGEMATSTVIVKYHS